MKRLLFIAHRVPYPPDKGERVRAFHEIKALAEHFRVTLAALAHSEADLASADALKQWCESVLVARAGGKWGLARGAWRMLRGRSVSEGYFASKQLTRQIGNAAAGNGPFDLVMGYSSGVLPYVLAAPAARRIMDLVDVDSTKWAAYANEARWPKSLLFRKEASAVASLELEALGKCNAAVVVSDAEARLLPGGDLRVTSEKVHSIGNGVDTEYFAPMPRPAGAAPSLVFTGTMDYHPNIDGVCWFVHEVWPGLRRAVPNLTFNIVGRDPAPAVRRLAAEPGVTVTGSVPDVRPYLAAATVAVCPLRIARGVQNKVLEAMAMGRAVVASLAALEGIAAEVGKDVLQADAPEQWQEAICTLLADAARREKIEHCARECVVDKYRWPVHTGKLVALCEGLLSGSLDMHTDRQPAAGLPLIASSGLPLRETDAARSSDCIGLPLRETVTARSSVCPGLLPSAVPSVVEVPAAQKALAPGLPFRETDAAEFDASRSTSSSASIGLPLGAFSATQVASGRGRGR